MDMAATVGIVSDRFVSLSRYTKSKNKNHGGSMSFFSFLPQLNVPRTNVHMSLASHDHPRQW